MIVAAHIILFCFVLLKNKNKLVYIKKIKLSRNIDTTYGIIYNIDEYNTARGLLMSRFDKLINEILNLSNDLRFDELRKVLEYYGYTMNAPKGGSSHYTFRKDGCMPITIPKHEPIKKVYVKMVKEIVEGEQNEKERN